MSVFNYNKVIEQYKSSNDIYVKFPKLKNLAMEEIIKIGLDSHFKEDRELAAACRALIVIGIEANK